MIDVEGDKVDVHLTDLLDELRDGGRYRTKVRVHTTPEKSASINKSMLLEAGASKVEIITEAIEQVEVASSSLFEKFDTGKIRETYEEFCHEKQIENVALGLHYLSTY